MKFKNIELGMVVEAKGKTPSLFQQVHGTKIIEVPNNVKSLQEADGAFTKTKTELSVFSADCMPVLFFGEDETDPVAAIHSGWRGTRDGILAEAVKLLGEIKNLHVWIGPHIKNCCFEVKEDFLSSFKAVGKDPLPFLRESKFDLLEFAFANDLKGIQIANRHLEEAFCTFCTFPTLPSFRRQKHTDPRIRSWIRKC